MTIDQHFASTPPAALDAARTTVQTVPAVSVSVPRVGSHNPRLARLINRLTPWREWKQRALAAEANAVALARRGDQYAAAAKELGAILSDLSKDALDTVADMNRNLEKARSEAQDWRRIASMFQAADADGNTPTPHT